MGNGSRQGIFCSDVVMSINIALPAQNGLLGEQLLRIVFQNQMVVENVLMQAFLLLDIQFSELKDIQNTARTSIFYFILFF